MTGDKKLLPELALLLLLGCLWGSSYTLIKIGIETIPPLTLIAARTAIAGVVVPVAGGEGQGKGGKRQGAEGSGVGHVWCPLVCCVI